MERLGENAPPDRVIAVWDPPPPDQPLTKVLDLLVPTDGVLMPEGREKDDGDVVWVEPVSPVTKFRIVLKRSSEHVRVRNGGIIGSFRLFNHAAVGVVWTAMTALPRLRRLRTGARHRRDQVSRGIRAIMAEDPTRIRAWVFDRAPDGTPFIVTSRRCRGGMTPEDVVGGESAPGSSPRDG